MTKREMIKPFSWGIISGAAALAVVLPGAEAADPDVVRACSDMLNRKTTAT